MQSVKLDGYYSPTKNIKTHWVKFNVGSTVRYYDSEKMHPFDDKKLLIWGLEGNYWQVVLGGHTIRVKKSSIEKRTSIGNVKWNGLERINILD
jgi:hypothetical protein